MIVRLRDWSFTPGPRKISEGKFSAEQFYKDVVIDAIKQSKVFKSSLVIDLDGLAGVGGSFLDELIQQMIWNGFRDFSFTCEEMPSYVEECEIMTKEYLDNIDSLDYNSSRH